MRTVARAIWGRGGRGEGKNKRKTQDIQVQYRWYRCDLTKNASKDHHDMRVAATDTTRTLAGACVAGVGAAKEDTHNHCQRRWQCW